MSDNLHSIYHKYCPRCAAAASIRSTQCSACGHVFDSDAPTPTGRKLEQILEEERLYEDYLAARVTQASQTVMTAQAARMADPDNPIKATLATEAVQALEVARNELSQQSQRVAELQVMTQTRQRRASLRRAPRANQMSEAAARTTSITRKAAEVTQAALALQVELKHLRGPAPEPAVEAMSIPTPKAPVADNTVAKGAVVADAKPHSAPAEAPVAARAADNPSPIVISAPAPSHPIDAGHVDCPLCSARVPRGTGECACGYSFAGPTLPGVDGSPAPATNTARARLARDAERVVRREARVNAKAKTKSCPHCTADVALSASRCKCGYVFSEQAASLPALDLGPADADTVRRLDKPR